VTIIEFSDFRCGFCGVHSRTLAELVAAYPGKIRRVFKHFPLQVNADGMLPHLASMAAMAQGRFWEMHRALMNKPVTGRDDILSRAVALGFDMERFERELAVGEGTALIQRDVAEGDGAGIRMTPTTFINGRMLSGRQSLEMLKERVAAILTPGTPPPAGQPTAAHLDLLDGPSTTPPAAAGDVKCCGL
jgi:protein-disulfide isomerase